MIEIDGKQYSVPSDDEMTRRATKARLVGAANAVETPDGYVYIIRNSDNDYSILLPSYIRDLDCSAGDRICGLLRESDYPRHSSDTILRIEGGTGIIKVDKMLDYFVLKELHINMALPKVWTNERMFITIKADKIVIENLILPNVLTLHTIITRADSIINISPSIEIKNIVAPKAKKVMNLLPAMPIDADVEINNIDIRSATDISGMFEHIIMSRLSFDNIHTGDIKTADKLFRSAQIGELDISKFNTKHIRSADEMFSEAVIESAVNKEIRLEFNRLSSANGMFFKCNFGNNVHSVDIDFNGSKIRNLGAIFKNFKAIKLSVNNIEVYAESTVPFEYIGLDYSFLRCKISVLNINNLEVHNAKRLNKTFFDSEIRELHLENIRLPEITHLNSVFELAKISRLQVENVDLHNVYDITRLFYDTQIHDRVALRDVGITKISEVKGAFERATMMHLDLSDIIIDGYIGGTFDDCNIVTMTILGDTSFKVRDFSRIGIIHKLIIGKQFICNGRPIDDVTNNLNLYDTICNLKLYGVGEVVVKGDNKKNATGSEVLEDN